MPAVSEKQRKFMGAELSRTRKGKRTKTKMSESQLEHFASKPLAGAKHGAVIEGEHKMPDGHMMKDSDMKKMRSSHDRIKSGLKKAGYEHA